MPTEQEVQDLADAMWQLLDDMRGGLSVCLAAKAEARIAFEPFIKPEDREACCDIMTLADAVRIEKEASR